MEEYDRSTGELTSFICSRLLADTPRPKARPEKEVRGVGGVRQEHWRTHILHLHTFTHRHTKTKSRPRERGERCWRSAPPPSSAHINTSPSSAHTHPLKENNNKLGKKKKGGNLCTESVHTVLQGPEKCIN